MGEGEPKQVDDDLMGNTIDTHTTTHTHTQRVVHLVVDRVDKDGGLNDVRSRIERETQRIIRKM